MEMETLIHWTNLSQYRQVEFMNVTYFAFNTYLYITDKSGGDYAMCLVCSSECYGKQPAGRHVNYIVIYIMHDVCSGSGSNCKLVR